MESCSIQNKIEIELIDKCVKYCLTGNVDECEECNYADIGCVDALIHDMSELILSLREENFKLKQKLNSL